MFVDREQVNVISPQPAQAALDGGENVSVVEPCINQRIAAAKPGFRGDYNAIAAVAERFTQRIVRRNICRRYRRS